MKEIRGEKLNLIEEKKNLQNKLETTLEENQCRILILEKQNMELENKLTSVKYLILISLYIVSHCVCPRYYISFIILNSN